MTYFLVTYDRIEQHSDVCSYTDGLEAFDEFVRKERELGDSTRYEVVMLAAEREEDLHVTHANFFTKGDMLPA
jgi:hypothetical protein